MHLGVGNITRRRSCDMTAHNEQLCRGMICGLAPYICTPVLKVYADSSTIHNTRSLSYRVTVNGNLIIRSLRTPLGCTRPVASKSKV